MTPKHRIIAIVPAYNEQYSISEVVCGVLKNTFISQCVVVDDGSLDETAANAKKAGAYVIRNSRNIGSGSSTHLGLLYAVENGADVVVVLDADGQHNPDDIDVLISEIRNGADYAIGSRYIQRTRSSTSLLRKIGTKIISACINASYGTNIHDATSGFRAMNKPVLQRLSAAYPYFFPEPEILIELVSHNYVIHEVPVAMRPRRFGKSTISLSKACNLFLYIIGIIIQRRVSAIFSEEKAG